MHSHRRRFLQLTGAGFAAFAAGCAQQRVAGSTAGERIVGALEPDPAGILDLPPGFSYRVLSRLGDRMDDGATVPDAADGMGCFDLGNGKLALVRNHELSPGDDGGQTPQAPAFDTFGRSLRPLPGGTTNLVLDARTLAVERQHRTLVGTIRNCAGGVTPWGTWLTCEENTANADGRINRNHGWAFEIPADAPGLVDPLPLTAMGRFKREAACVDPATGIVYQTEDQKDSLFYRFIPKAPGTLAASGQLQALVLDGVQDTRNWGSVAITPGQWLAARWIDMDDPESPADDLRTRGAARGGAIFARGEGIWMGDGEMYFTATSGGAAEQGQIWRLRPRADGADMLQLFFESTDRTIYSYGDNLTIAPNGHLIVCEDQYALTVDNHLRGITPDGTPYAFARLRLQTEPAGACFSPDGTTLFVNAYSPAMTLAITGPWPA